MNIPRSVIQDDVYPVVATYLVCVQNVKGIMRNCMLILNPRPSYTISRDTSIPSSNQK